MPAARQGICSGTVPGPRSAFTEGQRRDRLGVTPINNKQRADGQAVIEDMVSIFFSRETTRRLNFLSFDIFFFSVLIW